MTEIAVLTSGGLDSYIAFKYAQYQQNTVKAVFVDYGQPYIHKELSAIHTLHSEDEVVFVKADCAHSHLNNVPTVEKQEVFGRNLLLAFYGALVAPKVWMVSLVTENNPTAVRDKTPEFFQLTGGLLSFLLKGRQLETMIESPFASLTKTSEVALALRIGVKQARLLETVSCYDPEHQNCGRCSTCFKRWIALSNNGIEERYTFLPYSQGNEYAINVVKCMREMDPRDRNPLSRFSYSRRIETHNALIRNNYRGIFRDHNYIIDDEDQEKQLARLLKARV